MEIANFKISKKEKKRLLKNGFVNLKSEDGEVFAKIELE